MKPKISIVTIAYNSAATIEQTLQSVVAQSYDNKEYIVIDGASTDETMSIVGRYADQIDVVVSEPDRGISDAFNKGIARATGDIIVFINSDDYLLPDSLTQVAAQYDGLHDIYCGNLLLLNPQTNYECRLTPSTTFPTMPFFRKAAHQGCFITKSLYDRLGGYDTAIRYPMDLDFLMRAYRSGAKFKLMPVDVAVFRIGGVTSQDVRRKKKDYLYMVRHNGGNDLQAYTFYYFLLACQTTKRLLNCFGKDMLQKLRYRKTQTPT